VKTIQKFVQAPRDQQQQKITELETKLTAIELPRKEIEAYSRSNAAGLLFEGYSTVKRPDSVTQAEQHVKAVGDQITKLWPQWQAAYGELVTKPQSK
jgi:hypothetical protein